MRFVGLGVSSNPILPPMPRVLAQPRASCCRSCTPATPRSSTPATEAGSLSSAEPLSCSPNKGMSVAQPQYASAAGLADAAKLAPPPAAAFAATFGGGPAAARQPREHTTQDPVVDPAAQPSSFAKSIRTLSSRIQPTNYNMVRGDAAAASLCPGTAQTAYTQQAYLPGHILQ